jgi:hypothetical protein
MSNLDGPPRLGVILSTRRKRCVMFRKRTRTAFPAMGELKGPICGENELLK